MGWVEGTGATSPSKPFTPWPGRTISIHVIRCVRRSFVTMKGNRVLLGGYSFAGFQFQEYSILLDWFGSAYFALEGYPKGL